MCCRTKPYLSHCAWRPIFDHCTTHGPTTYTVALTKNTPRPRRIVEKESPLHVHQSRGVRMLRHPHSLASLGGPMPCADPEKYFSVLGLYTPFSLAHRSQDLGCHVSHQRIHKNLTRPIQALNRTRLPRRGLFRVLPSPPVERQPSPCESQV